MLHMKIDTRRTIASLPLLLFLLVATGCAAPPEEAPAASTATVFEGARLIVGDGSDSDLENATFIVDGDSFVAVGATGEVEVPEGAASVDLGGRTVIPALIDTHVHFSIEREALIEDLQRKAYYGVGAAMGLGRDVGEDVYQVRAETIPGVPRATRHAGRGITTPEPGRTDIPYWVETEEEARAAVRELAELEVDIVKDLGRRPRRAVRENDAGAVYRDHRRGAPARAAGHRPHLRPGGRQGPAACGDRRVRPTASATRTSTTSSSSWSGSAAGRRARAEPGGPRRRRGPGLAERDHPAR